MAETAAPRLRASDFFSAEELRANTRPSDVHGVLAVATSWAMILGVSALAAWKPGFLTISLALVILGGRHLALAILMHETAHRSLFTRPGWNDWVGLWLCGAPTLQDLRRYRPHHLQHHRWAGSPQDPDADLVTAYPCTRASFFRKVARDLSGLTGLKRLYGVWLMDSGQIEYTVSNKTVRLAPGPSFRAFLRLAHPWVLAQLVLLGAAAASGHAWLYLLWVASYLTTFSVFVRIRSMAEHACTEQDLDVFRSTRTTWANPLARVTVAPHRVNFHLEHHLLMTAPYFRLPLLHRLLAQRGALAKAHVSPGYLDVIRRTTARTKAGA